MSDKVKQPDTDRCQGLLMWHSHIAILRMIQMHKGAKEY